MISRVLRLANFSNFFTGSAIFPGFALVLCSLGIQNQALSFELHKAFVRYSDSVANVSATGRGANPAAKPSGQEPCYRRLQASPTRGGIPAAWATFRVILLSYPTESSLGLSPAGQSPVFYPDILTHLSTANNDSDSLSNPSALSQMLVIAMA